MKDKITKTFVDNEWLKCLAKIRRFIEEYDLELISINLEKIRTEKGYIYEAEIEYKLGLR